MKKIVKKFVKAILPEPAIHKYLVLPFIAYRTLRPIAIRQCNICNYKGNFWPVGRPARLDARCPECRSLERHRLIMLGINRGDIPLNLSETASVLHFAPEPILESIFRDRWNNYQTADLFKSADLVLDLEKIELPDASVDLIIANHVLEHVDDEKTSHELHRILTNDGVLLCMVPIVEGWKSTYENESVETEKDRWIHFGQGDHLRFFGHDFRSRIEKGGLTLVSEMTAGGADVIDYGLVRGEKVFVFQKCEAA